MGEQKRSEKIGNVNQRALDVEALLRYSELGRSPQNHTLCPHHQWAYHSRSNDCRTLV